MFFIICEHLFFISAEWYNDNDIVYFVHQSTPTRCGVQKTTNKSTIMVWPTIQLHGCQIHYNVVSITLVHSVTGHSVVTYLNTLSNDASIDVMIRFYIILVAFSIELCNSDICPMTHLWWYVIFPNYVIHNILILHLYTTIRSFTRYRESS